jgi:hypothetical protein
MSEEGGWDLDFPGEPDAASNDEIPTPMVTLEQVLEKAGDINYHHLVEVKNKTWETRYKGDDVADAIVAYSAAIEEGGEYVIIESLRTSKA